MKFKIDINIPESNIKINHYDKILTVGSCFSSNIAAYLTKYKFNIMANPFGTLYNPLSILNSLEIIEDERIFKETDLIKYNGQWHSFYHHSDFSGIDPKNVLDKINANVKKTKEFIKECKFIFITIGTAFVYRHKIEDIIVSNCHQIPAKEFERFCLSYEEAADSLEHIISILRRMNPNINIIFTLSPVRYWPKEAVENQKSKATLLLAIHKVLNNKYITYFPSYELMVDDLRDYRFYKEDLVHPADMAIEYIWEKFSSGFFSKECNSIIAEVNKILLAVNHKPREKNSDVYKRFLKKNIEIIENLIKKYDYIDFKKEILLLKENV